MAGNNGINSNVTDSTTGLYNIMDFNGTSAGITITPSFFDISDTNYSINLWANFDVKTLNVLCASVSGQTYYFFFIYRSDRSSVTIQYSQGSGAEYLDLCDVDIGDWNMFTMVKEGTTLTAYCNGIEQGSATFNPPSVSTGLYLGKLSTGSARFDGKQKDPIFWDRALSDIEVQELYYSSKII